MKKLLLITALMLVISCVKLGCKKDEKYTFIFDVDATILSSDRVSSIEMLLDGNTKIKRAQLIELIDKEVELNKQNGSKKPFLDFVNNAEKLHIKVTPKTIEKTSKRFTQIITPGIDIVIKKLIESNHEVFIIGGGYSTCDIISKALEPLGIKKGNIFSGKTSFKNGLINIAEGELGFVNCATNELIEPKGWKKSDVIKFLKSQGIIKGKVVHIGDGENDLEVWKAKEADIFIGFGVNSYNKKVEKESKIYVKNMDGFEAEIKKIVAKDK